eukprot:CAMPEP_0115396648 /NCGR_PEP_ID=MMETSP0271-20121206/13402_1 /TAXON_ID=71861 /ORGANISM="Scrippsiella trochoidea, Strain CCMP3099" /LENGTH=639 /DNA_ID=CAMNT_0002820381 /DNA_START=27 /DNA_END=1946 /DNA_ORIENTATION=+
MDGDGDLNALVEAFSSMGRFDSSYDALGDAVDAGDSARVESLLAKGANPFQCPNWNMGTLTAFQIASKQRNLDSMLLMVAEPSSDVWVMRFFVSIGSSRRAPLHGRLDVGTAKSVGTAFFHTGGVSAEGLEVMMMYGYSPQDRDMDAACHSLDLRAVELLLCAGMEPTSLQLGGAISLLQNDSSDIKALAQELAALLLNTRADPNGYGKLGDTPNDFTSPLHLAVLQNNAAMVDMLLEFGGDLSIEMQSSEWDDDGMMDVSTVRILDESRRLQLDIAAHLDEHNLENHANVLPDSKSVVRLLRLKLEQGLNISVLDRARCFWVRAAVAHHGGTLSHGLMEAYFQPGHFDLWRIESWPWGSAEPMEFQAIVASMPGSSNTGRADVETCSSGAYHSDTTEIGFPKVIQECDHEELPAHPDASDTHVSQIIWTQNVERLISPSGASASMDFATTESFSMTGWQESDTERLFRESPWTASDPPQETEYGDVVHVVKFTRCGQDLQETLHSGKELETIRAAAREAGQSCHLRLSGASIFVYPQEYASILSILRGCELRAHHVVIAEAFLPLLFEAVSKLPSKKKVRPSSVRPFAVVEGENQEEICVVQKTFLNTSPQQLRGFASVTQSDAAADHSPNPRRFLPA